MTRTPTYYPVFLDLTGRPCLVIGGGREGQRKIEGLLAANAKVTVISPALSDDLKQMLAGGRFTWIERDYKEGDVEGYALVIVATDDGAANAAVRAEGNRRGVWVNAADDPPNCDFILPAIVRSGSITVATSTGGGSPALARRLREELEAYLTEEMPALAELLKEVRAELRERDMMPDAEVWQDAIDEKLRVLLAQRKYRQAKTRVLESLGAGQLVEELVTAE